jgi:hypothetical protein
LINADTAQWVDVVAERELTIRLRKDSGDADAIPQSRFLTEGLPGRALAVAYHPSYSCGEDEVGNFGTA